MTRKPKDGSFKLTEMEVNLIRNVIREKGLKYKHVAAALNVGTNWFLHGEVQRRPLTVMYVSGILCNPKQQYYKRYFNIDVAKALYEFLERDSRVSFLDAVGRLSSIQYDVRYVVSQISKDALESISFGSDRSLNSTKEYNALFDRYLTKLRILYSGLPSEGSKLQLIGRLEQIVEDLLGNS